MINRSVQLLQPICRDWIFRRFGRAPWFPGEFCQSSGTKIPPDGVLDIVLFGDFVRQILRCERWPKTLQYRLWTLSHATRDVCSELLGIPAECVGVIPRYELLPPSLAPRRLPRRGEPWTLVYSGRFSPGKNFDHLLRVVSSLQTEFGEPVRLALFGEWDELGSIGTEVKNFRDSCRQLIEQLPWTHRPEFFGIAGSKAWHKRSLKNPVFVSLSTYFMEDFGVSLAQAQAAGWPCILSDWGGHRDAHGPNVIKLPVHLLGRPGESESTRHGRALAIARLIFHELSRTRSGTRRPKRSAHLRLAEPTALDRTQLRAIRGELKIRFRNGLTRQDGARMSDWFTQSVYGRGFYERYVAQFSGRSASSQGSVSETVVASRFDERYTWQSLNQIIPAIESAWAASADPSHSMISLQLKKRVLDQLPDLARARTVVFPFWSHEAVRVLEVLRQKLRSPARIVIHTHGEGTYGAHWIQNARPLLRADDHFICASRAEARALRLCYPKALISVAPFPIHTPGPIKKDHKVRDKRTQFAYVGRISEQKNLHTLLVALWALQREGKLGTSKLHVFGRYDRLGSPNMGMPAEGYAEFLRKLTRQLGLEKHVRWHGFVDQKELDKRALDRHFVFVSPSLHSDEDFGVAAYLFLSAGNRAILSAWGGHLDFAESFGSQVRLLDVRLASFGPQLSITDLAHALEAAIARPRASSVVPARAPHRYSLLSAALKLNSIAREKTATPSPLEASTLVRALLRRKARLFESRSNPRRVFTGYDDPMAKAFFEAYGAKRGRRPLPRVSSDARLILVPWARVASPVRAFLQDPHRGKREISFRQPKRDTRDEDTVEDVQGRKFRISHRLRNELIEVGALFELR